ncbi:putative reverse transcriptase domain-containing protein [Tanacetum coccineum]|uniref:Reverse transcriptase domain-containing protein n=1 Tax=Tanacetum coccineum TaxID=301880 RepID=A0ABQ5FIZ6_9ASTR
MSTQQDIYAAGSENRPPMLNKENYVPWSSRLLRDADHEVPVNETFHEQTDDEITGKELKQVEADDQAIQTILLGLPEDIYVAIDSCETAQEIWLRVQQMMKGSDIGIQEKKAKLFNEWERFASIDEESIESYYHGFSKLMNDFKRNKHFPEKIASNLKFLNNLQPEWSRHVTIVHQTKDLHTTDYTQLYDFLKSISTTIEADSHTIRHIGSSQYAVSTGQNKEEGNYGPKFAKAYGASHINDTIPRKEKDPGRLGVLAHTRLTVELADKTVKYPKGIAKNVLVGIGKFTFPVDFIILDMPEDIKVPLILGRPFLSTARAKIDVYKRKITLRIDHFLEDYIELNDLNEPFELRKNQGDDLMPTIEEGAVIEEFRTRDEDLDTGIDDYPRLEFTHVNFFPLLYVNVMSKKFHNSIMKDKMVYKGDNVVGTLMNVPIFVGTFSVVTDFAVLENMDAYRDKRIGDVIIGEPFLREVGIKARRFDGIITIYNSDDEVTYQMVSEKDEKNGISHAYQKLKGFYKGVLNPGPDYIRNAKTKEWLTREHISMHEME